MAWKTNLYPVAALLTVLWITRTVGNLLLTVPMDTVAKLGGRVELECITNKTTSDPSDFSSMAPDETMPVEWKFSSPNSDTGEIIFNSGVITHKFSSKYMIDNVTQGRYNLIMNEVDLSFAGTYTCSEQSLVGEAQRFSIPAELIVIERDPACNTNESASQSDIIEGDYIRMWCTVNYSGNWIPVMEWTRGNGQSVDADILYTNTSTTVTSSLTTRLTSSDNGFTFSCKTSIKPMNILNKSMRPGTALAAKVPHYEHLWNYTANVSYQNSTTNFPGHHILLVAVTGISAGALLLVITVTIITCKVRRRGKTKPDIVPEARQNNHDAPDRTQQNQSPPLYAEVQRNSNGFRVAEVHPLPAYASVKKERTVGDTNHHLAANNCSQNQNSIPVYAEVKKENKIPGTTGQITFAAEEKPKQNYDGADGTQYEEVSFCTDPNSSRVPVNHPPMFNLMEYASIDHTLTTPPPPLVPRRH